MAAAKFEIYRDVSGRFRWRLISSKGRVTATSGESYASFDAAEKAAVALRAESAHAAVVREPVEA